jgi:plasmid replication initiation protein
MVSWETGMSEAGKDRQLDIFQAAYVDIPIRDQRDLMERPFFSLAKRPRKRPISYNVNGVSVTVTPGADIGMATIWDADILIWAATQVTEALDRGGEVSPVIRFHPYTLLKGIRRHTGGDQYRKLLEALRRLHATSVETNIRQHGSKGRAFHWLEEWGHQEDEQGKPIGMSITLPRWLYDGIVQAGGVLTIHPDYFLLTGGIERWLYRIARKHAGRQANGWRFTMRQLHQKSGSASQFADFAIDVRKTIAANALPEYTLEISKGRAGEEIIHMAPRFITNA